MNRRRPSIHPEAPDPGEEVMYVDLSREKLESLYNQGNEWYARGVLTPSFFMFKSLERIAASLERIANALENEAITINMIHGHIENIDHAHIDDGELDIHTKNYW